MNNTLPPDEVPVKSRPRFVAVPRAELSDQDELWGSREAFDRRSAWIDLRRAADDRGECEVSVRTLAARWRWSKSTVASFLERLEALGRITKRRSGQRGTVYAVTTYSCDSSAGRSP